MKKPIQILVFILPFIGIAQPNISWQKSLGGTNSDIARSVTQTLDGGYIVAGYTTSINGDVTENNGGRDVWVVKLNSLGVKEWDKSYGSNGDEEAYEIKQTSDDGYIITGLTDSSNFFGTGFGNDDILVIKITSNGTIEWGKRFGTTLAERGHSVLQTSDNKYVVTGFIGSSGTWVVKLDTNGDLDGNWTNIVFGGSQAYSVNETSDNGFIVAGHGVNGSNGIDLRVFKLDATSNLEWSYYFGGTNADYGRSVQQTTDGGYIVCGATQSNNGDITNNYGLDDFWVLKLDAMGILQWQQTYGGTQIDFANDIKQTVDGGYIVVGQTNSDDNDVNGNPGTNIYDYWVIKLNSIGELQWQNCLGGSSNDFGNSIQQTLDDGFIIAGRALSNNNDVSGNNGNYDFWVVKLESETLSLNNLINDNIRLYPNPTSNYFTIQSKLNINKIQISDQLGKVINEINSEMDYIDVSHYSNGVYFLKIDTEKGSFSKKLIIN